MKKLLFICATVGFVGCGSVDRQPLEAIHHIEAIAEDVYVARPIYSGGNSTIIINSDHVVVVDTQGSDAAAGALIDEIRRLTDLPVKAVINTHWHGDHHSGNAAFERAYPDIEIIAHPGTAAGIEGPASQEVRGIGRFILNALAPAETHLAEGQRGGEMLSEEQMDALGAYLVADRAFWNDVPADFAFTLPNRLVNDQVVLEDARRTIEIFHPGWSHTDGDLMVRLPSEDILIAGDVVTVPYVVPRSGFPEGYAEVLGDIGDMAPATIVPGHGIPGNHAELVSTMAGFLEEVADLVTFMSEEGQTSDEMVAAAASNEAIQAFQDQIQWDAEDGLTFMNWEMLVQMTTMQAIAEHTLTSQP